MFRASKPEHEAKRSDHARRNSARIAELEDQAKEADDHQHEGDVRVSDYGQQAYEPALFDCPVINGVAEGRPSHTQVTVVLTRTHLGTFRDWIRMMREPISMPDPRRG